jgi:chorismate--pyruvate lyase
MRSSSLRQYAEHQHTTRWFNVKSKHHELLDSALPSVKPWLLAQGSLTQQLRSFAGGQFKVLPLHESLQHPKADEIKQLRIKRSQRVWVREVLLYGNDKSPWVHARSVMPLPTLRGSGRRLKLLKNRSLGSVLFERGGVQRVPKYQQRKSRELSKLTEGWTRRTTYVWHNKVLLVQETFLPAFITALNQ